MNITTLQQCQNLGLYIDGTDKDGGFVSNEGVAPFVVFDAEAQENFPQRFETKQEAVVEMLRIANLRLTDCEEPQVKTLTHRATWIMFSIGILPHPMTTIVTLKNWKEEPKVEFVGTRPADFLEEGYLAWWPLPYASLPTTGFFPDGRKANKVENEAKGNVESAEVTELKRLLKEAKIRIEEQDAQINKMTSQIVQLGFRLINEKN